MLAPGFMPALGVAYQLPPDETLAAFSRSVGARANDDLRRLNKSDLRGLGERLGIDGRAMVKSSLIAAIKTAARHLTSLSVPDAVAQADLRHARAVFAATAPAPAAKPEPTWMYLTGIRPLGADQAVVFLRDRLGDGGRQVAIAAWRAEDPGDLRIGVERATGRQVRVMGLDRELRAVIDAASRVTFEGGALEGPPARAAQKPAANRVRLAAMRPAFAGTGRRYFTVRFLRVADGRPVERVFPRHALTSPAEFRRAMPVFGEGLILDDRQLADRLAALGAATFSAGPRKTAPQWRTAATFAPAASPPPVRLDPATAAKACGYLAQMGVPGALAGLDKTRRAELLGKSALGQAVLKHEQGLRR